MQQTFKFLPLEDLSPFCRQYYNNCSNESALNFQKPVGCWKGWVDDCTEKIFIPVPVVLVVIIIIIAVLSFVSNTIVCIVFCIYDQLRLVKHYFVINLAVVDNIIVTISIPLFVAHLSQGIPSSALCRGQILLDVVCGTASILSMAIISLERYIAVEHPLLYNTYVTPSRAVATIFATWVYSVITSCVTLFSFLSRSSRLNAKCLFFGGGFVIFITATSFIIPLAIMIVAYWRIFKIARHHARRITAMHVPQNQPQVGEGEAQRHVKLKRELKGAKTLTIIMGTHIICWCPLFVYLLVVSFCPKCYGPVSKIVNYIIVVLRYCNTLANPIIYSGINRQFRAAIMKFLLCRRGNEGLGSTVYTNPMA